MYIGVNNEIVYVHFAFPIPEIGPFTHNQNLFETAF